jgi:hypothetical protein
MYSYCPFAEKHCAVDALRHRLHYFHMNNVRQLPQNFTVTLCFPLLVKGTISKLTVKSRMRQIKRLQLKKKIKNKNKNKNKKQTTSPAE